jgi:phosphoribosylanthranilate isomerase
MTAREARVSEVRVKICGLTRREDAERAVSSGADYLGAVLVPETPRFRTPDQARELLTGTNVPSVIVFANQELAEILRAAETVAPAVIQLHGEEPPELVASVREGGPWTVWKALRVRDRLDVERGMRRYAGVMDGLLLDGWHAQKRGGSGVAFPWEEIAEVESMGGNDVLLAVAGGLTPENVGEAVARLGPDVVDVSSGVESRPGIKDQERIERFIRNVRAARKGAEPW